MRRAWLAAAVLSGIPSTAVARWRREPLLDSVRAAGTLLGRPSVARGVVAHGLVSAWWAQVLWRVPWARRPVGGAVGGAIIAGIDLGIVGRRFPAIRALPAWPQVADHVLFGAIVGLIARRSGSRPAAPHW
jgi:hypothetical protein